MGHTNIMGTYNNTHTKLCTKRAYKFDHAVSRYLIKTSGRFIGNKNFLIADEPTGSLDEVTADSMVKLIRSFCTQFGMGVIISTHDVRVAHQMAVRYKLHNGIVEQID